MFQLSTDSPPRHAHVEFFDAHGNAAVVDGAPVWASTGGLLTVTPDADGNPHLPNYGATFLESDYARIPPRDLPWGLPSWIGEDSQGRAATPKRFNCIRRSPTNKTHSMIWDAPEGE